MTESQHRQTNITAVNYCSSQTHKPSRTSIREDAVSFKRMETRLCPFSNITVQHIKQTVRVPHSLAFICEPLNMASTLNMYSWEKKRKGAIEIRRILNVLHASNRHLWLWCLTLFLYMHLQCMHFLDMQIKLI